MSTKCAGTLTVPQQVIGPQHFEKDTTFKVTEFVASLPVMSNRCR